MFERFDDPADFVPDDRFRAGVERRSRQLRRRRRATNAAVGAVTVVALAAGGIGLYVARRDAAIDRVDVATQPSVDGAVNILLLGSDARPPDDPDGVTGQRADTIAVLRLDESGDRLLSIPRDLVDDAGVRINQGFDDGVQGAVDAVVRTTGIPVDHVIAIDFAGFQDLVDAVGGLEVAVTASVRDVQTGLLLEPSDCTTLDGETVLQLVRARHLEHHDEATGNWVADPTGDLGRISRQQIALGLALGQAETDLASIDRFSQVLADHATVDDGLTLGRLVELGRRIADGAPLELATLPTEAGTTENGAAVLVPTAETGAYEEWFGAVDRIDRTGGVTIELPVPAPTMPGLVPFTGCSD